AVAENDVTQFVSHDAGDLAFVLCGFDHSPVDVHRSTRKREGVDFADVDKLERVLELRMAQFRRDDIDEPTTNIPNVARQQFVAENWQLLFRLGRSLPPKLNVLGWRYFSFWRLNACLCDRADRQDRKYNRQG